MYKLILLNIIKVQQPKTPHPLSSPDVSSASETDNPRVFRFSLDSCSKGSVNNDSVSSTDSTTTKSPDNAISDVL